MPGGLQTHSAVNSLIPEKAGPFALTGQIVEHP
jgi:hypothetical protein